MIYVFLIGLIVSSILTWAIDTAAGVHGTLWAVTGIALLIALPSEVSGAILRLAPALIGGGCLGCLVAVIVLLVSAVLWGLNIEKHAYYAAVPAFIVGALIGTAMLYAVLSGHDLE
ncbi:MAG: hypothetical protein OXH13_04920 [Chloroflexi bacterium]|nr:hypothetical protein [Chloroflexota bacterium]MCY3696154.1 hypothetical protein [Chloroflexota bacterium]